MAHIITILFLITLEQHRYQKTVTGHHSHKVTFTLPISVCDNIHPGEMGQEHGKQLEAGVYSEVIYLSIYLFSEKSAST